MGIAWSKPFAYAAEGVHEAASHLPGGTPYDVRNPNSPYYGEAKSIDTGGRAVTPSEVGYQNIGTPQGAPQAPQGGANQGGYSAPDPYAQYGGEANYNSLRAGFDAQKNNIYGSATDAANGTGGQLRSNILDFVQGLQQGQRGIDSKASKNELAKIQGTNGILASVGRGIKSSGVMLANRNAGTSSAAGALAAAYGDQGRRQLASVGNQYALGNEDIKLDQTNLDEQRNTYVGRKYGESKTQAVNNIVLEARNQFAQLDAAMANASLPDRIAIEQEKEKVRTQVLGQLQQYDQLLQSETGKVHATSQDQRREEAQRLATAGTDLGADAFQYTTETPTQFQNTGPFASDLPLFSTNRSKRQFA